MKKSGCFLIILVIITFTAVAAWYEHELDLFNANRQAVMQNCENALPVFKKRYATVEACLRLYEKHYGWENGVFKGNPNTLQNDYEDANSDVVDITKISPELKYSQPVQAGLARLNGGGGAVDQYMGALDINDNLPAFIEAISKCGDTDAIPLLGQLKSDLVQTKPETAAACGAIVASINRFNDALNHFPSSMVARQFDIFPISRASGDIQVPSMGENAPQ